MINYMTKLENRTLSYLEYNCICHKAVFMVSGTGALSSTGPKKKVSNRRKRQDFSF